MITEYLINKQVPTVFRSFIPFRYAQMIEQDELLAVGAYDTWEDEPVGVILFRQLEGWMELVWLYFSENYRDSEDALMFLERRLTQAKNAGILNGAFIDFADEEEAEPYVWMLQGLGFHRNLVSNQVYELTLADAKDTELLHRKPAKNVRSLGSVNEEIQKKLVKAVTADARAIPLSLPVDWSLYDEAISVVYMNGIAPEGMLLFEHQDDDLVFSCAWATDPRHMVPLLSFALSQAEQILPPDTCILIPILEQRVAKLVERLVPSATCRMLEEWSMGFRA